MPSGWPVFKAGEKSAAFEVNCAWQLHSSHFPISFSLFSVIYFNKPDNLTFSDLPRSLELSGVLNFIWYQNLSALFHNRTFPRDSI